jgi:hypothetical protein
MIFLLHQAEEQSDANKFVVGLRMAGLLFVTNNVHNYCSNGGIVHLRQSKSFLQKCAWQRRQKMAKQYLLTVSLNGS